jgi:hypothetical protein
MDPARNLKATLTYWSPSSEDNFGAVSFGAPITLRGRWEERSERVRKPNGDELESTAVVFVDRDLLTGGFLIEGDFTFQPDPHAVGAKEIQALATVPDIRSVQRERRAYL